MNRIISVCRSSSTSELLSTLLPPISPNGIRTPCRGFSATPLLLRDRHEKRKLRTRKPRSLGRAPTKLEIVDPDPFLEDEEEALKADWAKQYLVDMEHVVSLMREKIEMEHMSTVEMESAKRWIQEENLHHEKMMVENDKWNAEVGAYRETAMREQRERDAESTREASELALSARAAKYRDALAHALSLQEKSPDFVTLDNVAAKVEEALDAEIVDYNFSIDRSGNVNFGESYTSTLPPPTST